MQGMSMMKNIISFFKSNILSNISAISGFYENLYLCQCYCWYAFIRQDFLMYYRYSAKWIRLFNQSPAMISVETGHYVKGMHTLLNAHFDLRNYRGFQDALREFETFSTTPVANHHDNFRIQTSIYINLARLNWHLMSGSFKEGLVFVPEIEARLKEYELYVDKHRILVFNYKLQPCILASSTILLLITCSELLTDHWNCGTICNVMPGYCI